jgi:Ca2+-binding EF-hand superfamily protein
LAEQEVLLLRSLDHRNIVHCFDSFVQLNTLVIIVEYCEMGDLRRHIKFRAQQNQPYTEEEVMRWFVQLADALAYIHGRKVLHRDIKTSNAFLKGPGGSSVLLGDFGISRVLEGSMEAAVTVVGTPFYMAPEVCRSEPYGYASDVWSLGCVLYELCTLKHAFASDNLLGLVYRIVSESHEPISDALYSKQLRTLVDKLLSKSSEKRPSAAQLLVDEYVRSFIDSSTSIQGAGPAGPAAVGATGSYSLRPGATGGGGGRVPPPPQHPPPTVAGFLPEGGSSQQLVARLKRKLIGQKIHWVRVFADNDKEGRGGVNADIFETAIINLDIGFGRSDAQALASALNRNGFIAVDDFRRALDAIPGNLLLADNKIFLTAIKDPIGFRKEVLNVGASTITIGELKELLAKQKPGTTEEELDKVICSIDKLRNDSIPVQDVLKMLAQFPSAPGPVAGSFALPTFGTVGGSNQGMMHGALLPGPLVGSPPRQPAPVGLGSRASLGGAGSSPGLPTSPKSPSSPLILGQAESFATAQSSTTSAGMTTMRLLRKVERHVNRRGLRGELKKILSIFERDRDWITKTFSSVPLGLSRAEIKFLKDYLDKTRGGAVMEVGALVDEIFRASTMTEESVATLLGVEGVKQLLDELANRSGSDGFVEDADVRKAVMRIVPFLQTSQLEAVILTPTVKNINGQVDLVDLALRSGVGASPQRKPFGSLVGTRPGAVTASGVSDDTFVALAGRVAVRLEELGISDGVGLGGLLRLADVFRDDVISTESISRVLEMAPLGLSPAEAETLTVRCTNGLGVGRISDVAEQVEHVMRGGKLTSTLTAQLEWIRSQLRKVTSVEASIEDEVEPTVFAQLLRKNGIEEDAKIKALTMFCDKKGGKVLAKIFVMRFRTINTSETLSNLLLKK